jgi:regulator of protease activity HflC (stomatin/prohibitin superfamily)
MAQGARVTDEVEFYKRRGQLQSAVRVVRARTPERLRWRAAVASMTQVAGELRGRDRARIEEPVREIVLDLDDKILRRESVLDARRSGVDLDRGEVLPFHTRWDLRRTAFLTGVDHEVLGRHIKLPAEYSRPIDVAAVVIVSRALAQAHKLRSERLLARLASATQAQLQRHEQYMLDRAERDKDLARRWIALAKVMVEGSR